MSRILLIRHGRTELLGKIQCGRIPGVHLSAEGRTQAGQLGRGLSANCRLDLIVASPLERTLETAESIAAPQNLTVQVDAAFNELDFGSWTGKSFGELEVLDEWKRYNKVRSQVEAPGGESLLDVQARASVGLRRLHEANPDATVAIVTHGDVIRALLMQVLGMPLDHILRLEISPASVSELMLGQWEPRVLSINRIYE